MFIICDLVFIIKHRLKIIWSKYFGWKYFDFANKKFMCPFFPYSLVKNVDVINFSLDHITISRPIVHKTYKLLYSID